MSCFENAGQSVARRMTPGFGSVAAWLLTGLSLVGAGCDDAATKATGTHELSTHEQSVLVSEVFASGVRILDEPNKTDPRSSLSQVVTRLQQWLESQKPLSDWQVDPLVAQLPESIEQMNVVRQLGELRFEPLDGHRLREARFLRQASLAALGGETDDVRRAERLFDWVIRNIQLLPADQQNPNAAHLPWEVLVLGRGTAAERAWIFALMARQQGLDVVLLTPDGAAPSEVRLAGLWSQGELYLFDAALGLPLPGPGQTPVATLRQLREDEALLTQLDIDEFKYPLRKSDFDGLSIWIESSPVYLAQRMRLVELQLSGDQRMTLSTDATQLAEQLKAAGLSAPARLWPVPYERQQARAKLKPHQLQMMLDEFFPLDPVPPRLWQARTAHLMGQYTGDSGATMTYQGCRPSESQLISLQLDKSQLLSPELAEQQLELVRRLLIRMKQDASFWLGVLAYEQGNYAAAIDFFAQRSLAAFPQGPWTAGAHYNLGRTYEATGYVEQAAEQYRAAGGPQRHGNLLRARRLLASTATTTQADPAEMP